MSDQVLNVTEAADHVGYAVTYMYQMRWDNRGPKSHRNRNGRLYYLRSELDEWLEAQDAKAAASARGGVNA